MALEDRIAVNLSGALHAQSVAVGNGASERRRRKVAADELAHELVKILSIHRELYDFLA